MPADALTSGPPQHRPQAGILHSRSLSGPGGGGGRIAVWFANAGLWAGALSYPSAVTNGLRGAAGGQEQDGQPGTLVWYQLPPAGTVILLR